MTANAAIPQVERESMMTRGLTSPNGWDQIRVTVFRGGRARIHRVRLRRRTGRGPEAGGRIAAGVTSAYAVNRWNGPVQLRQDQTGEVQHADVPAYGRFEVPRVKVP